MVRGVDGLELGVTRMRGLVLDLDTVLEVATLFDRRFGGRAIFYVKTPNGERTVSRENLTSLGAVDRGTLRLVSEVDETPTATTSVSVDFYAHEPPGIFLHTDVWADFAAQVADFMVARGTPRIAWWRLVPLAPMALALGLVASWIAAEATTPMNAALHVFGWLLIASALTLSVIGYRALMKLTAGRQPGHRIRMESRAETAARRADEKKNLKVAAITAPITLAGGVLLAALLGILNI